MMRTRLSSLAWTAYCQSLARQWWSIVTELEAEAAEGSLALPALAAGKAFPSYRPTLGPT